MSHTKVLFILKKKKLYDAPYDGRIIHSGLFNSASFVNDMFNVQVLNKYNLIKVGKNAICNWRKYFQHW